ncbi:MAG: hypothetical protein KAS47_06825 [Candidatus Heimdallarchaeota archaeon]|nr:hypothetical protein [Candidatus Heimdallarchaeota archaeon]
MREKRDYMAIHVRYISQIVVRMNFEGPLNSKMEEELERCLKEQIDNAKKPLFYLIDITSYEPKVSEEVANKIADSLNEKGEIIQKIAFLFTKKKKIKNKELKDRIQIFNSDWSAQSWISDQSRFGFLDEITLDSLAER